MVIQVSKYKKEYFVKSYEVDCHGFLRILTLMNLLQDIAVENADVLGFGFRTCQDKGGVWVGSNYLVKIERLPKINEKIIIETWPAEGKLWGAIRNFVVKDAAGNIIIRASSQWVLIDSIRRRPVMLGKYFPEYSFLDEKVFDDEFQKLPAHDDNCSVKDISVRFDDIDINNHVNNAVYLVWASDGLDNEFRMRNIPAEFEVSFKKEALLGEEIKVLTKQKGSESIHYIIDKESGTSLAECRFIWRKITSKTSA